MLNQDSKDVYPLLIACDKAANCVLPSSARLQCLCAGFVRFVIGPIGPEGVMRTTRRSL